MCSHGRILSQPLPAKKDHTRKISLRRCNAYVSIWSVTSFILESGLQEQNWAAAMMAYNCCGGSQLLWLKEGSDGNKSEALRPPVNSHLNELGSKSFSSHQIFRVCSTGQHPACFIRKTTQLSCCSIPDPQKPRVHKRLVSIYYILGNWVIQQ